MGDKSGIAWTDATWNPTTGCDRVSPGCANCYALTLAARLQAMGAKGYERDGDPKTSGPGFGLSVHEDRLTIPLRWTRPRRIFVNSMSDLFHPEVPDEFIDRVFAVMALAPQHTFQILTKRPERMRAYMASRTPTIPDALATWPLPNVWLGTSVENAHWRTRIDELRRTPAAVRFLSCEPLLGSLTDWSKVEVATRELGLVFFDLTGIDWVIVGGESGPGARPMQLEWVTDIIAASERQHVAVFVKQLGSVLAREMGAHGKGEDPDEWPDAIRIRQWPGEQHRWVDARNELVDSGEWCPVCGRLRAGNAASAVAVR